MLIIRNKQMAVFQQLVNRQFVNYVMGILRGDDGESLGSIPDDLLFKRVEYGIECARKYELTRKNDLLAFVELMFSIAPDFYEYPAFKNVLTDETIDPNQRIEQLLQRTTNKAWRAARQYLVRDNWPVDL
ncbi:MAG: hypothetical protein GY697_24885 [Desulfobacterales bacterium]|nr:hypothetical protein [Desulfobacterales bacterium]